LSTLLESLNRWIYSNGLRSPTSLEALRAQLGAIWEMNRVLSSYRPELLCENVAQLEASLNPAGRSIFAKVWAILFDSRFQAALRIARSHRRSKASISTVFSEVCAAILALRHCHENCSNAEPRAVDTAQIEKV